MTVYETLISIDRGTLEYLHKKKLTSPSIFRDIEIYEFYLNERQSYRKTEARESTAQKFGVSVKTVSRILAMFKEPTK